MSSSTDGASRIDCPENSFMRLAYSPTLNARWSATVVHRLLVLVIGSYSIAHAFFGPPRHRKYWAHHKLFLPPRNIVLSGSVSSCTVMSPAGIVSSHGRTKLDAF